MKRRKIERWRRELEEPEKEILVPTLKEKIELGLPDQEWIAICYEKYRGSKCFREINGHKLCDLCPKPGKIREEELTKDIEILLAKTTEKLISKRR